MRVRQPGLLPGRIRVVGGHRLRKLCGVGTKVLLVNSPRSTTSTNLSAAQRAWLDVVTAGHLLQAVELCFCVLDPLLEDLDTGLGSDSEVGADQIYSGGGCLPEASRVINRLPVFTELSLSLIEFLLEPCCLSRIPCWVLGYGITLWRRFGIFCFVELTHDGNGFSFAKFFDVIVGPNFYRLVLHSRVRPIGRTHRKD